MRIAVSGANGFVGSWICRILAVTNEVYALVRQESDISRLGGIHGLNIRKLNESDFNSFVLEKRLDAVILCDWWGVENYYKDDARQFENVNRYRNRISSLREIRNVVVLGSQAELGPQKIQITEECSGTPLTAYGRAKSEVREFLQTNLTAEVRFIWGRVFSSYGPLDSNSWFIPSTIMKILNMQKVQLTKGIQEWSFLHAYDLGCAIETLVQNNSVSGIVNIGNPNTIRIIDVAKFIESNIGRRGLLEFGAIPYSTNQVMKLAPVTKKLNEAGWTPMINIEDGLSHLIDWMSGKHHTNLVTRERRHLSFDLPSYLSMK